MTNLIKEFIAFTKRGNVIDLAVAVVLGAAFNDIVKKIVDGLVMPLVSLIVPASKDADGNVIGWAAWKLGPMKIGEVLAAGLYFFIVAFAVFLLVNKLMKAFKKKEAEVAAAPAEPSEEILLLREIRDSLKRA